MDADLYKPFKLSFWVLKKLGMWQDGNQSWSYFVFGHLLHFLFVDLNVVSQIMYAINAKDLHDFIDTLGLLITITASMLKGFHFFVKLKKFKKLFETLESLLEFSFKEKYSDRKQIKIQVAKVYKIYKPFWCLALFNCFVGCFVPLFYDHLPYKFWFPFNTQADHFGFWAASYLVVFNSFIVCPIDIALDMLPITFVAFAIGLVNELSNRLSEIFKTRQVEFKKPGQKRNNDKQEELLTKELIRCIEVHIKIKSFIGEILDAFQTVILLQAVMSCIILCSNAFSVILVRRQNILLKGFKFFSVIDQRCSRAGIFSLNGVDVVPDFLALLLRQ